MKKILLLLLFLFAFILPARAEMLVRVSPGARFYSDTTGLYADVAIGFKLTRLFWLSAEVIYDHAEIPITGATFQKNGLLAGVNLAWKIPLSSRLFLTPQTGLGAGSVFMKTPPLSYDEHAFSIFLKPALELNFLLHPSFSLGVAGGYYVNVTLSIRHIIPFVLTATPYAALTLNFHFGQGGKK